MPSTRRMILLGGVGAAGGLIVGYTLWPSGRIGRADKLAAGKGERFLTNWIKIGTDDTITVVIPHGDMGQGIFTALPQMAAEELDADWSKVRSETAPPDPVFTNGALAEVFGMQEYGMSPNMIPGIFDGLAANGFRTVAEYLNLQATGGSSAVRATGVLAIRVAAAAAREMLVKAAAARWKVSTSDCSTKLGRVIHTVTGKSFGYGELTTEAAAYDPSTWPKLKVKADYKIVGQSIPRVDIPAKTNGTLRFSIDAEAPDMLYAALRASPVFGSSLMSVDDGPIKGKRGIVKLVKLEDAVVVVADRFWRARDAVAALNPIFDPDNDDNQVTSATIKSRHDAALKGTLKQDLTKGSGADALAQPAARIIEATYRVPYLAHAAMEPMNATALYKNGTLEVWAGTQDGLGSRAFCAKTAGLKLEQVTFHQMAMGGSFGRKGEWSPNFLLYAVKTAMAVPGRPVKLIFTREEDIQQDYYRPAVTSRFSATLGTDGLPAAWVNDYTTEDKANPEAHILYAIPNQRLRTGKVESHVQTGVWRSVESSWHGFFIESFVDELAHAAKTDPLEYRRGLLKDRPRHLATLNLAADKAGWQTPLGAGRARGIAIVESFQTIVAHVAEVSVVDGGKLKVDRIVSAVDVGTAINPDGLKAQIEGAIIYGLTAALNGEITIDKGAVIQANFPDYEMVRLADAPQIEVYIHDSDAPYGGGGEPGTPPVAPAVTNAIFAATGVRIRELPVKNHTLTASLGVKATM